MTSFMLIILIILEKFMAFVNERTAEEITATETNQILQEKTMAITYGTYEKDLESGNCSTSSSHDTNSTTTWEGLYDGKVCVICYDEERNCFFVPCGHCATCYDF
ncbi:hypothetical protein Tsubulata_003314 [Turnera subulata]|uniref:Uncharacterized protein n=1 Tax=Turnera subulata TaxID=218843 RepID=A0A9Q0GFA4_9ROSI|nr:hypothetical protein Tsubulata_003314 [Turnera subulata]